MEISKKGLLDIDLILAFMLILLTFVISATVAAAFTESMCTRLSLSSDISSKIARSYGLLSQLSDGRDNEILLSRLQLLNPKGVSLKSMGGYYYGGKASTLCIQRAVYIKDINEVGILEVC